MTAVLVPISLLLNDYGGDGNYNESSNSNNNNKSVMLGLTRTSLLYLVFLLAFLRGSASLYFSLIGMATGRTLRVVHKDEAARIMTIGALLVRSLAPIIAGGVVSHFMTKKPSLVTDMALSPSPLHSSWMVWIVIGLGFGLARCHDDLFPRGEAIRKRGNDRKAKHVFCEKVGSRSNELVGISLRQCLKIQELLKYIQH